MTALQKFPLLGLPKEVLTFGDASYWYYTAVVNNLRVFVYRFKFDQNCTRPDKLIVEVDDDIDRPFGYQRYTHFCDDNPLAVLAAIYELTSGGNNEGPHGHQGARADAGHSPLDDRESRAGVDHRQ